MDIEVTTTPALLTEPIILVDDTPRIEEIPAITIGEKTHVYQPTDEQGRPIGGKQVIKYTTQDELISKLEEQNVLILRKLREETRRNRLGISDESEAPTGGQKFSAPIQFKPKELSPDERVALSRDLLDPERQGEATKTLWKSVTGVDPDTFNEFSNRVQADNIRLQAKVEADAFVASNRDYVICNENFEAITNWMMRYELAPVRSNFQKAFEALKAAGILIINEESVLAEPVVVPVQVPLPLVTQPVEYAPAHIPTGLTRSSAGDGVPPTPVVGEDVQYVITKRDGSTQVLVGKRAIDAMPADELRRRVKTEAGFSQKLDAIEADFEKRRRQGANTRPI